MILEEKINRFTEKNCIVVNELKIALEMPIESCPAGTLDEAYEIYRNAVNDTEEEVVAIKRMEELIFSQLDQINTFEEIKNINDFAPADSDIEVAVLEKMIQLCTTFEQIKEAHTLVSLDSIQEHHVLEKWIVLCTTISEIRKVYKNIGNHNDVKIVVLKKWLELCSTSNEVEEVYGMTNQFTQLRYDVLKKWFDLFE